MRPQPDRVAARLGLDAKTIRRLQARGHLPRLALTEAEIRKRFYHAHLAYLNAHHRRQTSIETGPLERATLQLRERKDKALVTGRRVSATAAHRHLIQTTEPKGATCSPTTSTPERLLTREHTERLEQEARNEWLARDLRETRQARRGRKRVLALPMALVLAARRRSPEADIGA